MIEKKDTTTIKVTTEVAPVVKEYTREQLASQKSVLTNKILQENEVITALKAQLADIESLEQGAINLGVKTTAEVNAEKVNNIVIDNDIK